MGKNFSCNNASGRRHKNDFYQTPYSITNQLLENEEFDKNKYFLDPACGNGAILEVLYQNSFNHRMGIDINHSDEYWRSDFLNSKKPNYEFQYIITNPPFSLALEFIQKAKEVATEKFAMLLPLQYLHGQERFEKQIFTDPSYPLTKVYIFTRYPLLSETIRSDGKYKTGMISFMWAIWEKRQLQDRYGMTIKYNDIPVIKWIDNQQYILSKKDL